MSWGGGLWMEAATTSMHPYQYDPTSNNWTIKSATFPDNQVNNMACGVLADSGTPVRLLRRWLGKRADNRYRARLPL